MIILKYEFQIKIIKNYKYLDKINSIYNLQCLRKNIIHIIGARPQFIKLAIRLKEIKKKLDVKNLIIYIRQHYDYEMSKFFF